MKVVFLPAAEHDLGSLFEYISEDLQNLIAAKKIELIAKAREFS